MNLSEVCENDWMVWLKIATTFLKKCELSLFIYGTHFSGPFFVDHPGQESNQGWHECL